MSRADLVRSSGLSRTTVSSLVTRADPQRPRRRDDRPRSSAQGRQRPPSAAGHPERAARAGSPGSTSATGTSGWRSPTGPGASTPRTTPSWTWTQHGTEVLDRAAAMVRGLLSDAGLERDRPAGGRHVRPRAPGPAVVPDQDRHHAGLAGPAPRRGAGAATRGPGPRRQRRQPGRARRAAPRHRPRSARLVYLKMASGLGAGIVLGGRLHRGASGIAGEIGHVQVGEDGHVCRCGNRGCLETLVAAPRLLELLQPAYDQDPDHRGRARARRATATPASGGCSATRAGRSAAPWPTWPTASTPSSWCVGGSLGASPSLLTGLRGSIDRYAQPDTAAAVEVVAGELGDRAEVVGAVTLAIATVASA